MFGAVREATAPGEDSPKPPPALRELAGVAAFVVAYLLAAVAAAAYTRNTEFIFYIAVMVVLIGVVLVVRARAALTLGLLWALAIWGALHMAGGLVPVPESWPVDGEFRVLYSWWILPRAGAAQAGGWLKYDQVVHAYGFGVTTWLCWQGLRSALQGFRRDGRAVRPTFGLMILVAAAGAGFGALNEIIEFVATRLTTTNVGGYENTGWDLVYNLLGAVVASTLIYRFEGHAAPRRRGSPPSVGGSSGDPNDFKSARNSVDEASSRPPTSMSRSTLSISWSRHASAARNCAASERPR